MLLQQPPIPGPEEGLRAAILGENSALQLLLTFSTVVLATLSAWWLRVRLLQAFGAFEAVLGLVVGLQIAALPIFHGVLLADRKVRVLASIPRSVQGVIGPLGIVDRTGEHVALLGRGPDGFTKLVAISIEDLNGVPIERSISLREFLVTDLAGRPSARPSSAVMDLDLVADSGKETPERRGDAPPAVRKQATVNKGFFQALADRLQMTFEAIGSLGDSVVNAGQVWAVEMNSSGGPGKPRRIGSVDDLTWPVAAADGSTFYALREGRLLRLVEADVAVTVLDPKSRWRKLLGVTDDGKLLGLVREGGEIRPGVLTASGDLEVSALPLTEDDKTRVARLLSETRSYAGDQRLSVGPSVRGGRGFDIFLHRPNDIVNLSDCGDDSCGQASLSPNLRTAVFIHHPRY